MSEYNLFIWDQVDFWKYKYEETAKQLAKEIRDHMETIERLEKVLKKGKKDE